ncbi:MAG: type II toxin-antitoxin system PrlF family antitoxin [Candidatus Nomurabacteria bacterium]|jgi:AbrB family looped-hinge helix DNA binding protein|nr:type II toxin-antitoxin system PrlF family antitoxin [Candidatus Nomurabacteria bacterium]
MSYIATISSKGQITLPKPVRDLLAVEAGDKIEMEIEQKTGKVKLERALTLKERFKKLHLSFSPEIRANIQKYKGMTINEIKEDYAKTPEWHKEMEEKYGKV